MTQTEPIQLTHQGRSRGRTLSWACAERNVKQDIKEEIDPMKSEPDDVEVTYQANLKQQKALQKEVVDAQVLEDIWRLKLQLIQSRKDKTSIPTLASTSIPAVSEMQNVVNQGVHHTQSILGDLMLPDPQAIKWTWYRAPLNYSEQLHIDLHKYFEQCEIIFQINRHNYLTEKSKILLARQYLTKPPHDDWNCIVKTKVNPTWTEFKKCLKKSLKNPAMKRQEAFDEYLKLHQQKGQTALKYLRKLKNQLPKLDDDVHRSEALLMKFQLRLLSSNKDCLALLPSKNNYNVNEQATWVTWNKRTNLELLSQSQH